MALAGTSPRYLAGSAPAYLLEQGDGGWGLAREEAVCR